MKFSLTPDKFFVNLGAGKLVVTAPFCNLLSSSFDASGFDIEIDEFVSKINVYFKILFNIRNYNYKPSVLSLFNGQDGAFFCSINVLF